MYARDPMMIYKPKNRAADSFHRSKAYIRYFRGGNRTSKTQTGYAEHYFIATGQHKWRNFGPPPNNTFLVSGLPFTQYDEPIFARKMIRGESGNIVSPMFPEGGKWFYHYDPRKHILTIACPECAEQGKAQRCPGHHRKSTIMLLSSESGTGVIEGFTATLGHGDEHLPDGFLNAMKMRVADNPNGCLIFTGTPLHGLHSWETEQLAARAAGAPAANRSDPDNINSAPWVTLHEISQWDAGIISHEKIRELMQGLDDFEIMARVEGKPAPIAALPVFDVPSLKTLNEAATDPIRRVDMFKPEARAWETLAYREDVQSFESKDGMVRIWEEPNPRAYYMLCADSSAGLIDRDPSCCSVLKVEPLLSGEVNLTLVAQLHGWLNPLEYAAKIFLLGVYYNYGPIVVELTGGLGRAVMLKLKELGYWNIFSDPSRPEKIEVGEVDKLGVETQPTTKPAMVAALQHALKSKHLSIPCRETILELRAFEQIRTESGLTTRYQGASGSHDDRVMSLAIGCYVILTFPVLEYFSGYSRHLARQGTFDEAWGDVWGRAKQQTQPKDPFGW